jgi:DNA-binding transcriptional regulator of glucitol operon
VKSKWFSSRAFLLHLVLLLWLAICASAAWWQVGRAIQGNTLSYMYSIEWPVFGVLGVLGWYAMLNMDRVTEHDQRERRAYEEAMRAEARERRREQSEDPTLAAYNDHLAELAGQPKRKLWGH